ncbi:hypothetical protein GURASL_17200 [Geotalea uraniireducens]|uniref:histidine kinase n=1 Tax=Geotalea uraniireducens TaxID=351604 RepID=A0ABN6VTM9_9BACT|nr:transporter substrate-binding domain-containing protein [Geotalea uraniireducens]BDV42797.1 hypothetical protein GURASL_17200 [Geotalea uraniireducens]
MLLFDTVAVGPRNIRIIMAQTTLHNSPTGMTREGAAACGFLPLPAPLRVSSCPLKTFVLLLGLITILSLLPVTARGAHLVLRVGGEQNLPISSVDEDGKAYGIIPELLNYIAAKEGWTIQYVPCTWHDCLAGLDKGDLDLLMAIAYSPDRAERYDFNRVAALSNWGQIYAAPGVRIESLLDLQGKRIAVVNSDTHQKAFREMFRKFGKNAVYVEVDKFADVFSAIAQGRADAGIVNRFFGLAYAGRYPVKMTPVVFNPIEIRFAAHPGESDEILKTIDRYLVQFKEDKDSPYYAALDKWLVGLKPRTEVPGWVKWGGSVLVSVALAACAVVLILRRQIRARTAELEASKRFNEKIVETVPALIYLYDFDRGHCTYVNELSRELLGYGPEEVIAMEPERFVELLHPDDLPSLDAYRQQMRTASSAAPLEVEYRVKKGDGGWRWLRSRETVFRRSADGRPGQSLGVAMDITERRRSEEEIRQLNEGLEQRIRERTEELERMNLKLMVANEGLAAEVRQRELAQDEISWLNENLLRQRSALEEANRELESFSYSVSHDLQAPLRHIAGYSSVLLEECHDQLSDEGQDYLQRIKRASLKMEELIDALLDLARISRKKMNMVRIDLSAMVREIVDSLREREPTRTVTSIIADGVVVHGDEPLLRAVMENLVGNAWKFTGNKAAAVIEFGVAERDGQQVYFVRDNGAGFDMTYVDRLFGPFQRLHAAGEFEGTGIGLATVQRIIKRHGGAIRAEGKVGEGATFSFTLGGQPVDG